MLTRDDVSEASDVGVLTINALPLILPPPPPHPPNIR